MPPVIGGSRLEKRFAESRQVILTNSDTGILDRDSEIRPVAMGANGNTAATRRELDGIGNEIDQDLVECATISLSAKRSQQLAIA
jgi:hypothetical protein